MGTRMKKKYIKPDIRIFQVEGCPLANGSNSTDINNEPTRNAWGKRGYFDYDDSEW